MFAVFADGATQHGKIGRYREAHLAWCSHGIVGFHCEASSCLCMGAGHLGRSQPGCASEQLVRSSVLFSFALYCCHHDTPSLRDLRRSFSFNLKDEC